MAGWRLWNLRHAKEVKGEAHDVDKNRNFSVCIYFFAMGRT